MDVIVVTGDRDSYQLVRDPHIQVLYNKRGVSDYALYDEAGIFERTGVTPLQYVDYAALRGDTSDNLPGVPGIGEKTAAKLVSTYDTLEGIFEHLDDLPPKQRQNLGEFQRPGVPQPGDVGAADATCDARRSSPTTCASAAGTRRPSACCSSSSSSARSTRGCSKRSATTDDEAAADGADARRRRCEPLRDGRRRSSSTCTAAREGGRALRASSRTGTARPSRARLRRARVHRRRPGRGLRARRRPAATRRSPTALAALLAAGGPPLVAHRAKELMHGLRRRLDVDVRDARPRHRGDGVPGRPGGGEVRPRRAVRCGSAARAHLTRSRAGEGTLDLDGDAAPRRHRPARRSPCSGSATRCADALEARELTDALRGRRATARRACSPRWRTSASRLDREFLDELRADLQKQCDELESQDPRARGRAVRHQLGAAAAAHPVRGARAHAGEAHEDRAVDRRRLARRRWPRRTRTRSSPTS